jgi:RNA polymerase sigma factor (sigma-70 family)
MTDGMAREGTLERDRLADLYVAHAPEGIRLAFLLTGDRALAEDLVQDAFARLVGRLRDLRDPGAFGAYLRRTIVNLATSHFRHRRVEWAYLEREAAPLRQDNPNEALDETMHAVLLRLPQILRCSAGTVRSLVSRAMKTLRESLEGMPL